MKLTIRLRYRTRFGEELFLCGNHARLGGGRPERAMPLRYVNQEFWEAEVDLPESDSPQSPLSYYFIARQPDGSVTEDFGNDRMLDLRNLGSRELVVIETWNDLGAVENVFFTKPFRERAFDRNPVVGGHWFEVKAPLLPKGQTVCLLGSAPELGAWNQSAPVLLRADSETGRFRAQIDLSGAAFPVAYKYGIYDTDGNAFVRYEEGEDRTLTETAPPGGCVIVNDGFARWPVTLWRGAGVAIPVFSLRSEASFGAGEFSDLRLLGDWARRAGLKLIQILPVNDTSATHSRMDSYPYSAISIFALHPLYLNLDRVAGTAHKALLASMADKRQRLNALDAMDYEAVMKAKLDFIRRIFPGERDKTMADPQYQKFFAENEHWLLPYAAFCFLRDKFRTADFNQWPEHRVYDANEIRALAAGDAVARLDLDLHAFVQFHLHLQLRDAVDYLHGQGLVLKGDMAIGVHPNGADVWQHPELFHTDMQAGAPTDAFAVKGQNWGFPTYDWPRMKADGFAWWRRRLGKMDDYFDAFRIDHILGFFRIWSIPRHAVEGVLGYFVPALPVKPEEFAARGIVFNRERFARPFINDVVLQEICGDNAEGVKRDYLEVAPNGTYSLKPEFATQRAVELRNPPFKEQLFDLISNVLLIEVPGDEGVEFHFRIGMDRTSSFRHLDVGTQPRMMELYIHYFYRRQEDCWRREALGKLPALKRMTNMLICGEDLGMVPACVPDVMKQLALLSLEIQRMPKALNLDFSRPADAPYLSVVTPGTHDMSTIRGWWTEDRNVTQKFFNQELRRPGPAPSECEPWIVQEIVRQHLESPAMWSIFQLQDLLGMDETLRRSDTDAERINLPSDSRHYWRYRMHLPLEKLILAENLTRQTQGLVRKAGRSLPP